MNPKEALQTYWGYSEFRPLQEEIIQSILKGNDTVALLPTGGGKSICFQIPALIQDGVTLVISPLLALMQDQVQNLERKGINSTFIKSGSSTDEIVSLFDSIKFTNTKLLYVSPERLQSKLVLNKLKEIKISLLVIDEAHCISEWGHDFRPSFLTINSVKSELGDFPIVALTASANNLVLKDIQNQLQLRNPRIFKNSFLRANLAYQLFEIENKNNRLLQIAKKIQTPIIVYTNTRKRVHDIHDFLTKNNFASVKYHGGLTKEEKDTAFDNWMSENQRIMVATNAFGMGIDKDNVGAVIHMDLPYSIENYFQEAGRAGRNGKKAFAVLLWNQHDVSHFKLRFEKSNPNIDFIKQLLIKLYQKFQIAYGEFTEEVFDFNLFEFCQEYSLPVEKVSNTIQILKNNGVIDISKEFHAKSELQILIGPNKIDRHVVNQKEQELIELLLRSYTGLFTNPVKINEYVLANKLQITSKELIRRLNSLHDRKILSFQQHKNSHNLIFLKPREDDYTVNAISKNVKAYQYQKKQKLLALIDFIESKDICRSRLLLSYFDHKKSKDCGICDVCLKNKYKIPEELELKILALLKDNDLTSQEIFTELNVQEDSVLSTLKILLKKEQIKINFQNQYTLYEHA